MATRLDRLVTLLETGSTQLIRNTAAQQLADIQKQHPDELFNLLTKVVPFLKAKSWDTRIAAAKAIGGIVDHADSFDPNADDGGYIKLESNGSGDSNGNGNGVKQEHPLEIPLSDDQLQLATLDVPAILTQGKKLLGSAGKEYDYKLASMDPSQRLAHQKKTLSARLGLGGQYSEEDLIDETDLKGRDASSPGVDGPLKLNTNIARTDGIEGGDTKSSPVAETPVDGDNALSKRQLNMLKRKNKAELKNKASKVRVVDFADRRPSIHAPGTPQTPAPRAIKQEETHENGENGTSTADYFNLDRTGKDDDTKMVTEFKGAAAPGKSELEPEMGEEQKDWPFERLCEYLMVDMFDHNWEVRHGAAMGIRELLRAHGGSAGREQGRTRDENNLLNQRWLNDLASRLCCIFMLDRFGDYVSDNVVAPIRETAGQALGNVLQHLSPDLVQDVYNVLHRLVMQDDLGVMQPVWQACHGGMIGLRYLVAVRHDLVLTRKPMMDGLLDAVIRGLGDMDDDVRAVSAATLVPVSQEFVNLRPASLSNLISIVWDCLSNLSDDLSASTGSVMDLLSKLCSFPEVLEVMKEDATKDDERSFAKLVPRLYPFLRHTITNVRAAVLRALMTFLGIQGEGSRDWITGKTLRLIYQNILLERNEGVLNLSLEVWTAVVEGLALASPDKLVDEFESHLDPIVSLTLAPIGAPRRPIPMEAKLFIRPSGQVFVLPVYVSSAPKSPPRASNETSTKKRRRSVKGAEPASQPVTAHNIDGPMIRGDVDLVGSETMIRSKIFAARALGRLISLWPSALRLDSFNPRLGPCFTSKYSSSRTTAAMVAEEYAKCLEAPDELCNAFAKPLQKAVLDALPSNYDDIVQYLMVAQQQCQGLLNTFRDIAHVPSRNLPTVAVKVQGEEGAGQYAFSVADGEKFVGPEFDRLRKSLSASDRVLSQIPLDDARTDARNALAEAVQAKSVRDVRIRASATAALVALNAIPKKLGALIGGLMESIKLEEAVDLQRRAATGIVALIQHLARSGKTGPVDKVIGNLAKFYCMDTSETPDFHLCASIEVGVLSLMKDEDIHDRADQEKHQKEVKEARITRRGAREALEQLATRFGPELLSTLPVIRSLLEKPLLDVFGSGNIPDDIADKENLLGQHAVDAMSVLRALLGKFDKQLYPFVTNLMPIIIKALRCRISVLRYSAAKCLATICSIMNANGFEAFVKEVLPSINNAHDVFQRQGAIECIYHLISVMGDGILPYVIFLIVPTLGRMSDSDNDIRLIATTSFATLVKLVPLEAGIPDPPGLSPELLEGRDRERKFMAQMLDPKKVEPFEIPVAIKAELRSYQQDGVNWLWFLNRFNLHGVLCDDMGLGKTLQTLCIVASDHHMRAERYASTKNPEDRKLPSLIVCPPTLSGHWQQEIRAYAPFLRAVAYVGPPSERARLRSQSALDGADVIITSYEICRNEIDVLAPRNWNYCVLDEGHLIKNPNAKTTQAVKRLQSNHRLILSGTPIQNHVLELWSLFDFLMPGFLGTEKVFKDRFAKPIAASRFSKASSKEQEAGALALEALHKQVLPFLLRRLKEEVLDDLPPKIIQNYYCDLSDLQRKLFEDFTKREGKAINAMAADGSKEAKHHIFTALQFMRKLCNSPALVMKESHKQYAATQQVLRSKGTSIRDPVHAPKLAALRDLLISCGIGKDASYGADKDVAEPTQAVSQHRALIFCQMKEMLDIVQTDVIERMLGVSFLRLDGSVEASRRQDIVNKFNADPSYDVLLLTTSVGGLGLNLTGADTVIFVEHDWNPQKDIQAMDRAHRIGQKRTVNVHRLITRGTLEEKIMSLQRFKIDVASTVVNQQNAGLATMETDQILDLFNISEAAVDGTDRDQDGVDAVDEMGEVKEKGKRGFLDDLGELWDEKQYEDEYDLSGFLAKIKA